MLVHPDILSISVVALFRFEKQIDKDADGNLVSFPKGLEVFFLDARIEVIYHSQREKEKLPKAIKTYDRLDGRFSIVYIFTI